MDHSKFFYKRDSIFYDYFYLLWLDKGRRKRENVKGKTHNLCYCFRTKISELFSKEWTFLEPKREKFDRESDIEDYRSLEK